MGPGFDCLGMAVDIWNEVSVARADTFSLNVSGIDVEHIPSEIHPKTGESKHVLVNALRRAFEYAGESPMPPVSIICRNNIPICSGFGSSSAVIVGGLVAGLVLAGKEVGVRVGKGHVNEELLQLANEIEGHADNVAPAIYGGIQLCNGLVDGGPQKVMSQRIPCPDGVRLVVYVPGPDARLKSGNDKTAYMRSLLTPKVSRADAVFNIQRAALLIDSLHRGDLSLLGIACDDRLHQPIRGEKAFPHLNPMIDAAKGAGAHGCFLSGAGPTIMAICSGAHGDVSDARSPFARLCSP
jgi:homoserine kinase